MKLLFICNANQQRSPSFEHWFKEHTNHDVKSCGLLWGSEVQISSELLDWADEVYVMTLDMEVTIGRLYHEYMDKVSVIGVDDIYSRDGIPIKKLINYWALTRGF